MCEKLRRWTCETANANMLNTEVRVATVWDFHCRIRKYRFKTDFFWCCHTKCYVLYFFGRCDRMKLKQLSRFSQYDSSRFLYRGVLWNLSTAATRHWSIGSLNWQVWPRSWWHLSLRFAPNTFTLWLQSFIYRTSYILHVIIFYLRIPCFCLSWRRHSCCSSSGFISS